MTADTTPSLDKALAAWGAACRAWSRDDCTDATRLMKVGEGMMYAAIDYQCALEARAEAAEANARRLEEALRPFARFNTDGFDGVMAEVVPASSDNPSSRIEPIPIGAFHNARAALTTKEADRG